METAVLALLVILIFFIQWYLSSSKVIGRAGETRLSRQLRKALNEDEYTILDDLTLPSGNGTTQIDHIIVARYGIFVIETKNLSGWIFGGRDQAQWTQSTRSGKYRFQNPLRQNYRHTKAVEETLSISGSAIYSIVAFVGEAEPKSSFPENVLWESVAAARYIAESRTVLLTDQQVQAAITELKQAALVAGKQTTKAHISSVKERVKARAENLNVCPVCGSALVERQNKKTGESFYGCSKFPKCRGARKKVNLSGNA